MLERRRACIWVGGWVYNREGCGFGNLPCGYGGQSRHVPSFGILFVAQKGPSVSAGGGGGGGKGVGLGIHRVVIGVKVDMFSVLEFCLSCKRDKALLNIFF